jgi:hypothetical protein
VKVTFDVITIFVYIRTKHTTLILYISQQLKIYKLETVTFLYREEIKNDLAFLVVAGGTMTFYRIE